MYFLLILHIAKYALCSLYFFFHSQNKKRFLSDSGEKATQKGKEGEKRKEETQEIETKTGKS